MGVVDRVRKKQAERKEVQAEDSLTVSSDQSSLAVVEPAHIARFKGVMRLLRTTIEQNSDGSGMARMAFILTTLSDELGEELKDIDELQVRFLLVQIAEIIAWIGHGDNKRLPDSVRAFAELIQPSVPDDVSDSADTYLSVDTESR